MAALFCCSTLTGTSPARSGFSILAAVVLLFSPEPAPTDHPVADLFGVTAADLALIDRGQILVRAIEATDSREIATLGMVRIKVTPEFYAERLVDIARFKRDEAVLQIGTFSSPPRLRDIADLTLDESDVRNLRECRVGDCGVQLSADAIERFRREVDWRSAGAAEQASGLMRRILVEYVAEYFRAGTSASMQYADRSTPTDLHREFVALADTDRGGLSQFPALRRHLFEYPAEATGDTGDLIYWSKEKAGRRAVVSVTHLAISKPAGGSRADYAIASKHIYGTHYFDASLGLTILIRDRSALSPATYLAYFNRSRLDVFGGIFGGLARQIVSAKARAVVADQLARVQRTLEPQFAAAGNTPD